MRPAGAETAKAQALDHWAVRPLEPRPHLFAT